MSRLRIAPLGLITILALIILDGLALGQLIRVRDKDQVLSVVPLPWAPDLQVAWQHATPSQESSSYRQTLSRPIFSESRRPYLPEPPAPRAVAPKSKVVAPPRAINPGFTLAGTAITRDSRQAFLKSSSDAGGTWVREGGNIMGWRVSEIAPGRVSLEKSGQLIMLNLYKRTAIP